MGNCRERYHEGKKKPEYVKLKKSSQCWNSLLNGKEKITNRCKFCKDTTTADSYFHIKYKYATFTLPASSDSVSKEMGSGVHVFFMFLQEKAVRR